MNTWIIQAALAGALLLGGRPAVRAWDYEGHRLVNELALASLPKTFPRFVQAPAARERIAFLAGEPDRWRNSPDLPFRHVHAPEHFFDVEDLAPHGLEPKRLSPFRYEFVAQLAAGRARAFEKFPAGETSRDPDRTRGLPGFLPWRMAEDYSKLKAACSYLKAFEDGGTREEIENARQNVIYLMGVMGHFVGDAAQPLHTTKHFNGWVGPNPRGYTTNRTFHSWIDGGYLRRTGLTAGQLLPRVRPAKLLAASPASGLQTNVFPVVRDFLLDQFQRVEPLYQLDKDGKLSARGELSPEGVNFISGQLLAAAQMLGDLWLTAWHYAPPDTYLQNQLARRQGKPSPRSRR